MPVMHPEGTSRRSLTAFGTTDAFAYSEPITADSSPCSVFGCRGEETRKGRVAHNTARSAGFRCLAFASALLPWRKWTSSAESFTLLVNHPHSLEVLCSGVHGPLPSCSELFTARRCSSVRGNAGGRNASRWQAMYCATAAESCCICSSVNCGVAIVSIHSSFVSDWLDAPLDRPNDQAGYAHIPQTLHD